MLVARQFFPEKPRHVNMVGPEESRYYETVHVTAHVLSIVIDEIRHLRIV